MERLVYIKLGIALIGFIILISIVSLFYTPYDPYAMNPNDRFLPPSVVHLLGTDNFGRDNFSRVITGSRYTLFVAVSTVSIGAFIGGILGLVAGYFGGIANEIIMRVIDAISSFPTILLALVMVTVINKGRYTIIIALGIVFIPSFTRIVRSGTLQHRNSEFVTSAYIYGASHIRIMFVHILPNLRHSLISSVIIGLSHAILAEAGMSYLGMGIQPPIPSWGRMLFEGQTYLFNAPWEVLSSGLMIMITVLGFHYAGEGIQKVYC